MMRLPMVLVWTGEKKRSLAKYKAVVFLSTTGDVLLGLNMKAEAEECWQMAVKFGTEHGGFSYLHIKSDRILRISIRIITE